jgi:hypothetical protein
MNICLQYWGRLSTTGHVRNKFYLRRFFLPQLLAVKEQFDEENLHQYYPFFDKKNRCNVGKFCFSPLVSYQDGLSVSLDIVILSHLNRARCKNQTGDIDNLLKALVDGLRMAQNENETRSEKPKEGEEVFYTLLEDDVLVKKVSINHDRLYFSRSMRKDPKEVFVLIDVTIHERKRYS